LNTKVIVVLGTIGTVAIVAIAFLGNKINPPMVEILPSLPNKSIQNSLNSLPTQEVINPSLKKVSTINDTSKQNTSNLNLNPKTEIKNIQIDEEIVQVEEKLAQEELVMLRKEEEEEEKKILLKLEEESVNNILE